MQLQSSRTLSGEAEICAGSRSSIEMRKEEQTVGGRDSEFKPVWVSATQSRPLGSDERMRQSALRMVCDSHPDVSWMHALSQVQWRRLLRWLDYSGMALYFFDRVAELQVAGSLPAAVFAGLEQRLNENAQRTRSMIAESIAIQREFQGASVRYAILKGLSLWPCSASRPELRSQFDLDFLVAEEDLPQAGEILARSGYRLYGASGRSLEFKRNEKPGIALRDLYKDTGSWRVELHAEPASLPHASQLERAEWRELCGFAMPTPSSVDLFLGQGLHVCKHVCSEFSRASHLVEFRRHVLFRYNDKAFWAALEREASESKNAVLALGLVTLLITQVTGEFAPEELTHWTTQQLPHRVRLWAEIYGNRTVLGSYPGSKLYLLLQKEFEDYGVPAKRNIRQSLIPSRLPPPVIKAFRDETFTVRSGRYRMQLNLICGRLRFHCAEGLRFVWESHRWRRLLHEVSP